MPGGIQCGNSYCCDQVGSAYQTPDWAGPAWYRFTGAAGSKIAETPQGNSVCGTHATGYMDGGHPDVSDGEVARTVYFDFNNDDQYKQTDIYIINCWSYFVYYLPDAPVPNSGYCSV